MERSIKKIVEEEIEQAKNRILSRVERIFEREHRNSSPSSLQLQFKNKVSQKILTGEEIKGEENTCIELNLVDDSTGNIVDAGPQASASVEIVLLNGESDDDWSAAEFEEKIVREPEGKKPLLTGNVRLKLQGGVGVVDNVKLRHHTSKIRPSVFRLGARVVETFHGFRIKEAKTERFIVKDFRNKYYKKHEKPSLHDEVSRLVNIRKGGKIDKRLQVAKIFTVEDLLIRLLIDPQGLKSIAKVGAKKWDATVNHARACPSDRVYCYINFEQKVGVVFNLLGQVLGLYSKSQYASTTTLSENDKASAQELLASAYEHWENVNPFDDINSLQQYFTGLSTYIDPPNYVDPNYRGHDEYMTDAIGESSSRLSSFSFQSTSSRMNSIREISIEDFGSFSTDDVYTIDEAFPQHSPFDPATMFPDFDDFLEQCEYVDRHTNDPVDPVNGSNGDEQIDSGDVPFVESQGVGASSTQTRRWKKLFCVSRLFSVKKSVSVGGIKIRKKRKVG